MTPKEVVERWVELFNAADADGLAALYLDDGVNHQVAESPVHGRDAIREMFAREFSAAEMTCIPEVIHEAGDVAILEWRDPLGLRGCGFFTVRDGRIAFQRGYWDKLSFLRLHVVAGHEHHYERELPVRGTTGTSLLTPKPVPMSGSTIDTTKGTQHMIIGGGGTSAPSNTILTDPPTCYVITSVGPNKSTPGPGAPTGHFLPNYTPENAIWASVRDKDWAYGFAAFSVAATSRSSTRSR